MALGEAACPIPSALRWLVELYVSNPLFTLAVNTLVALAVLVVAEALVLRLGRRLPWLLRRLWLFRLARGLVAAGLVLVHEYLKEGYFFDPRDLRWPPRSHESFTVYVLLLSALIRRGLLGGAVG